MGRHLGREVRPLFHHMLPAGPPGQELEQGLGPPERIYLTVIKILQEGVPYHPHQMRPLRISPVGKFRQKYPHGGEKGPVEHREDQKENEEISAEQAQQKRTRDRHVSHQLYDGTECFKEEVIGQCEQADPPVLRVEDHRPVLGKGLEQAEMPPSSLSSEHGQIIRHFRPADRVRYEFYLIRFFTLEIMLVKPHDDLHVLGGGSAPIAPDIQHCRLEEQRKSAGKYQQRVQRVPSHSAEQKGPRVFHDLKHGKGLAGKIDLLQRGALKGHAVCYSHHAAACDNGDIAFHDRRDELDETVLLQERISVYGTKVGASRYRDPAVEGIGFAAPFFVNNNEIRYLRVGVKRLHGPGPENISVDEVYFLQPEGIDDGFERPVHGPVIDDDNLEDGIVDGKGGPYRSHDHPFFIVRRNKDGYRGRLRRKTVFLERFVLDAAHVPENDAKGDRQERRVENIHSAVIETDKIIEPQREEYQDRFHAFFPCPPLAARFGQAVLSPFLYPGGVYRRFQYKGRHLVFNAVVLAAVQIVIDRGGKIQGMHDPEDLPGFFMCSFVGAGEVLDQFLGKIRSFQFLANAHLRVAVRIFQNIQKNVERGVSDMGQRPCRGISYLPVLVEQQGPQFIDRPFVPQGPQCVCGLKSHKPYPVFQQRKQQRRMQYAFRGLASAQYLYCSCPHLCVVGAQIGPGVIQRHRVRRETGKHFQERGRDLRVSVFSSIGHQEGDGIGAAMDKGGLYGFLRDKVFPVQVR